MTTERVLIADSSPLIALARIDHLSLLQQLASRVVIPPAVWDEVTIKSPDAPGADIVRQATWLEIVTPDRALVETLSIMLDRGEAECIALAQSTIGSLLLLDDSRARRFAEHLSLRLTGTLGLLRRAKLADLIKAVRPQIEALQANNIFIHQTLIDRILDDVGEK
jgi:predicted nucleic acid-binding protein